MAGARRFRGSHPVFSDAFGPEGGSPKPAAPASSALDRFSAAPCNLPPPSQRGRVGVGVSCRRQFSFRPCSPLPILGEGLGVREVLGNEPFTGDCQRARDFSAAIEMTDGTEVAAQAPPPQPAPAHRGGRTDGSKVAQASTKGSLRRRGPSASRAGMRGRGNTVKGGDPGLRARRLRAVRRRLICRARVRRAFQRC